MSVFTIPFDGHVDGGTLFNWPGSDATNRNISWSPLGADKYIVTYRQDNPWAIDVRTVTYNGPSTSPTVGPVCKAITNWDSITNPNTGHQGYFPGRTRVYTNDAGTVALLLVFNLWPLSGGAAHDLIAGQFVDIASDGTATPSGNLIWDVVGAGKPFNSAKNILVDKLSDTKFYYNFEDFSGKGWEGVFTVNWSSKTITTGTPTEIAPSAGWLYNWTAIPGTTNYLLYSQPNGTESLRVIDANGGTVTTYDTTDWDQIGGGPDNSKFYSTVPVDTSTLMWVNRWNGMVMRRIVNGVPQGERFVQCTNRVEMNFRVAIPLNKHNIMALHTPGDSEINMMVLRLLSDGIGGCSTATHKSGGLRLNKSGVGGVYQLGYEPFYMPMYHKRDANTVLFFFGTGGGTSSYQLAYKVINQPS